MSIESYVATRAVEDESETQDSLRVYLNAIGKIALLNAEQEVELAQQIEAGLYAEKLLEDPESLKGDYDNLDDLRLVVYEGQEAQKRMIMANLRLVVSMAKRNQNKGVPLLDMIQDGNIGLMHAVEMFDYKQGNKFSTYASWWIRQSIIRQSWDQSRAIRLPVAVTEKIMKIAVATKAIEFNTGVPATQEQIANQVDMSLDSLAKFRSYNRDLVSLDEWVGDDEDETIADLLVDESDAPIEIAVEVRESRELLNKILGKLTPFEEQVLRLKYGFDDGMERSVREIATIIEASRPRVHRGLDSAMSKMKNLAMHYELHEHID